MTKLDTIMKNLDTRMTKHNIRMTNLLTFIRNPGTLLTLDTLKTDNDGMIAQL